MGDKTTIEILKQPTRKRLRIYKAKHELTYDEAINKLLDMADATTEAGE